VPRCRARIDAGGAIGREALDAGTVAGGFRRAVWKGPRRLLPKKAVANADMVCRLFMLRVSDAGR
jgi:hypothetical protein